jgi:hypothetical protein
VYANTWLKGGGEMEIITKKRKNRTEKNACSTILFTLLESKALKL